VSDAAVLELETRIDAEAEERATAYHEAGHAVMAALCGERVTGVEIRGDDEHWGSVRALRFEPRPRAEIDPTVPTAHLERRILCALAGMVAESIATGRAGWDERSEDLDVAVRLAIRVVGDCERVLPYLETARDHLEDLLCRHWTAVEAVAFGLMARREIPGDELRRLLGRMLP